MRVLLGSPFVEHINRAVFHDGGHQGQPLFLARGNIRRAEFPVSKFHFFPMRLISSFLFDCQGVGVYIF